MDEKEFRTYAKDNFVPIVRPKTSKILIEKVKAINPKKILEIGTAIGYSGLLMLENSNASLITLEKEENYKKIATENFEKYGFKDRVKIVLGDCKDYIDKEPEMFDFIFLDGPKSHYAEYLPHLLNMLNEDGLIFCDNVLFQGLVRSLEEPPKKFRTIVNNLRKFLDLTLNDKNLFTEILDVEDGIALIKKQK